MACVSSYPGKVGAGPYEDEVRVLGLFISRLFSVGAIVALLIGPAAASANLLAKAAAWRLGDQLSLAAMLYAQGDQGDKVDRLLADLKPLARSMGIEIKDFAPRAGNLTEAYAQILDYLIEGDGAAVGTTLSARYGRDAAGLFEVSMKSNLLILLYQPGQDRGIGEVIKVRCEETKLPKHLWGGVVHSIDRKAPQGDVKNAIFKMHDDVADYLLKQAE